MLEERSLRAGVGTSLAGIPSKSRRSVPSDGGRWKDDSEKPGQPHEGRTLAAWFFVRDSGGPPI